MNNFKSTFYVFFGFLFLILFFQNCAEPQWQSKSSTATSSLTQSSQQGLVRGTSLHSWSGLFTESTVNSISLPQGDFSFEATISPDLSQGSFEIEFIIDDEVFSVSELTLTSEFKSIMLVRRSEATEFEVSWKVLKGNAKVQLLEVFAQAPLLAPVARLGEIQITPLSESLKAGGFTYIGPEQFTYSLPYYKKEGAICVGSLKGEAGRLSISIGSLQNQASFLWALVKAETQAENSYIVRFNNTSDIWHVQTATGYVWRPVGALGQGTLENPEFAQRPFSFLMGKNTVEFIQREPGCIKAFAASTEIAFEPKRLAASSLASLTLFEIDPSQVIPSETSLERIDISDGRKKGVLINTVSSVNQVDIYINGQHRNRETLRPFKFIFNSLPQGVVHKIDFIGRDDRDRAVSQQTITVTVEQSLDNPSLTMSDEPHNNNNSSENTMDSSEGEKEFTQLVPPGQITYGGIRDFTRAPSCQNSPTHNYLKSLNGQIAKMKAPLSRATPCSQRYRPHWSMNLKREGLGMTAVDYFRRYHGEIMRQNELSCVGNTCPGIDVNKTLTIDEGPPKNGENTRRVSLQRNIRPGVVPNSFFAFDNFETPQDRICISLEVYIPNDFLGNEVGSYKLAYGVWGGDKPIGGGTSPLNQKGYVVRNVWTGTDTRLYSYHLNRGYGTWARQTASKCDSSQCCLYGDQGANGRITRGRWVSIEQEVVLNNKNKADGYARLWIDGKQVNEASGMLIYEDQRNMKIRGLFMNDMWGGYHAAPANMARKNETYWYTNFQVFH